MQAPVLEALRTKGNRVDKPVNQGLRRQLKAEGQMHEIKASC